MRRGLSVVMLLLAAACASDVPAGVRTEHVRFPALETYPGASAQDPGEVTGLLTLPPGSGPFPVVVMLHGCAGLYETHADWAAEAAAWGYASLRVDSFTARGIDEICTDIMRPVPRAADVNGALAWLVTRPEIAPGRIAVMGWSHGAGVALQAAAEPGSLRPDLRSAVLATVALYPWCPTGSQAYRTPTLVLVGDADDWTPASLCETMAAELPAAGAAVELVVYPGATHSFDCRACDGDYWGHRLVYDPAATADARARVHALLDATLATP